MLPLHFTLRSLCLCRTKSFPDIICTFPFPSFTHFHVRQRTCLKNVSWCHRHRGFMHATKRNECFVTRSLFVYFLEFSQSNDPLCTHTSNIDERVNTFPSLYASVSALAFLLVSEMLSAKPLFVVFV